MPALATERFDLAAMLPGPRHCVACATRVCDAVGELDGVVDARCDGEAGELEVTFDPGVLPLAQLQRTVEQRVRAETEAFGHAVYRLEGLD